MSGLLYNYKGFLAQGTEILGKGVSEEQTTVNKITTANGIVDTPVNITTMRNTVIAAGKSIHGLSH